MLALNFEKIKAGIGRITPPTQIQAKPVFSRGKVVHHFSFFANFGASLLMLKSYKVNNLGAFRCITLFFTKIVNKALTNNYRIRENDEVIRIISARKATRSEANYYNEEKGR